MVFSAWFYQMETKCSPLLTTVLSLQVLILVFLGRSLLPATNEMGSPTILRDSTYVSIYSP